MRENNNKGITLIALVITIIVMLILVGVTISMAVNGGLFDYAGKAAGETKNALNVEQELANGRIKVGDVWYDSIDDYLKGSDTELEEGEILSYAQTAKDSNGLLKANATFESDGYIAIVPKGFKIVNGTEGETSIAKGLVIQDINQNEFVWIPVTEDLSTEGREYEPANIAGYDSQEKLNELYGAGTYTYTENMYANEYAEMVRQVNENNGFYIGRYETTIDDSGKIGSKYNTTVLTASVNYGETIYGWHGLYNKQKTADITGNGTKVQTAMVYGILWDKTMDFIRTQKAAGNTTYDVDSIMGDSWHDGGENGDYVQKSGINTSKDTVKDVALNIWDLQANTWEWSQEAYYDAGFNFRALLGGGPDLSDAPASSRSYGWCSSGFDDESGYSYWYNGSRLIMYVK